jgi:hypothetical protein
VQTSVSISGSKVTAMRHLLQTTPLSVLPG